MAKQAEFSHIFIIGVGRSGTTLLRAILNEHSELCVTPEAHFALPLLKHHRFYEISGLFDSKKFVADLVEQGSFEHWHMEPQLALDIIKDAVNTPDAFRRLYADYAAQHRKEQAIDKTPSFTNHLNTLIKFYPEARFVHLIRDGRDVALSQYQAGWTRSVAEAATDWRARTSVARKIGKNMLSNKYCEISYERLVADPESEIIKLCCWIGVKFESRMLDYHTKSGQVLESVYSPALHKNLKKPIHTPKQRGTTKQRVGVEAIEAPLLKELDYIDVQKPSVKANLQYSYWYVRRQLLNRARVASYSWRLPQ